MQGIQDRGSENRQVVELQPCRRVGNQGEASRVAFRESVEREGTDREDDLLLRLYTNPVGTHTGTELGL